MDNNISLNTINSFISSTMSLFLLDKILVRQKKESVQHITEEQVLIVYLEEATRIVKAKEKAGEVKKEGTTVRV